MVGIRVLTGRGAGRGTKTRPRHKKTMELEKLRVLFKGERPSVHLFEELTRNHSKEGKEEYYRYSCFLFLIRYHELPVRYRIFVVNLIKRTPEDFLCYLYSVSGLSELQVELKDIGLLVKVFHLLRAKEGNVKVSLDRLAFCIRLGFKVDLKIRTLSEYIRQCRFTPESFFELAEYVQIYW